MCVKPIGIFLHKIMFTLIKKYTRQDITTPFFGEYGPYPTDYLMQLNDRYIKTNKIINSTTILSDDKTTQTTTILWNSEEDFLDFVVDGTSHIVTYLRKQHIYNLKNNITTETSCIGD